MFQTRILCGFVRRVDGGCQPVSVPQRAWSPGLRHDLPITLLFALIVSCVHPAPQLTPDSLAREAIIRRDRFGVPHIRATSEAAAAYAFGYAQAEDHGELIVRRLIAARGEEARYFGEPGV